MSFSFSLRPYLRINQSANSRIQSKRNAMGKFQGIPEFVHYFRNCPLSRLHVFKIVGRSLLAVDPRSRCLSTEIAKGEELPAVNPRQHHFPTSERANL